ncbi:hypothetical protein [Methylovulum miyakonense]|uniref:hypothetical protein n=1 Tax=Methylovulum miyakonense TaxID=645578 RepID=UPI00039EC18A|nr:hypothetical protein [Methylovulum miyakonense]
MLVSSLPFARDDAASEPGVMVDLPMPALVMLERELAESIVITEEKQSSEEKYQGKQHRKSQQIALLPEPGPTRHTSEGLRHEATRWREGEGREDASVLK